MGRGWHSEPDAGRGVATRSHNEVERAKNNDARISNLYEQDDNIFYHISVSICVRDC